MRPPQLKDIAYGVGAGLLLAVSSLTTNSARISLAVGAAGAVGVVLWRLRRAEPARSQEAEEAPQLEGTSIEPASYQVWIALALVAAVFVPTGLGLLKLWTGGIWQNQHGLFMPFIIGWMTVAALRLDPHPEPEQSAWGFALLIPGLALIAVDSALHTFQLAALGLVITLPGLALLLLGTRRTRMVSIPLLLGIFMLPIPKAVAGQLYLKQLTAVAVEPVLRHVLGIPVVRDGTLLELPNGTFLVADGCSGFATLYASVGVSIVMAAYARTWPRRILLLVAAWPLAIACNIVRVTVLVSVANRFGLGLLDTPFHPASGMVTFFAVLAILMWMADREALQQAPA